MNRKRLLCDKDLNKALFGRQDEKPDWAWVLGSGFAGWAAKLADPVSVPFGEVEGMALPTVQGHEGRFVGGTLGRVKVVAAVGRLHLYEGRTASEVVQPVRLMARMGAGSLLLTTAVGALAPGLTEGALVSISDQINLSGHDPATATGVFPQASSLYDPGFVHRLHDLGLAPAVLAGLRGPSYETPAEVRALRALGADVVCMSTVLEALAAATLGMRTAGVAAVANRAGAHGLNHAAVLETVSGAAGRGWPVVEALILGKSRRGSA